MSTTNKPSVLDEQGVSAKVQEVTDALKAYGNRMGYRSLEGRVMRGLDPAGMLGTPETREKVERIAASLGADMNRVEELTKELHIGAIWQNAEVLSKAEDPNVTVWMILANATTGDHTGDMEPAAFVTDLEQVNARLAQAATDAEKAASEAKVTLVEKAGDSFILDDDVPVSDSDSFLSMAICGHESGIVKDESGILFVGADKLDYDILDQMGLEKTEKEDRGKTSTFYVRKGAGEGGNDQDVVKVLYPGFCIVLTGDLETAKKLARTGMKKKQATVAGTREKVGGVV